MDKEYNLQLKEKIKIIVSVLAIVSVFASIHFWQLEKIGSVFEREALREAVVWSLAEEGIRQGDVEYITVVHAAGLSAPADPNRRYEAEVSITGETMYRLYLWKGGTAVDKSGGVHLEYCRYKPTS